MSNAPIYSLFYAKCPYFASKSLKLYHQIEFLAEIIGKYISLNYNLVRSPVLHISAYLSQSARKMAHFLSLFSPIYISLTKNPDIFSNSYQIF